MLSRMFIATPDERKGQLVFKWPDTQIRMYAQARVNFDQVAVFASSGHVIQRMGPGNHQINAQELPGLGAVIDRVSGGNAYKAELYFVRTSELTDVRFGGRVDDVQDPHSGLIVTLQVYGEYAIKVSNPDLLIKNKVGSMDSPDNSKITDWMSDLLLKVMRTDVTRQIIQNGWPILGLAAYSTELERTALKAVNGQLSAYGLQMPRMGNFNINLSEEDKASLKSLARDTSYSRLAGGYSQYAASQMAMGAGQGLAKGGGGLDGAFLGAGMGMGGMIAGQMPAAGASPVPPAAGFAGGGQSAYAPGARPPGAPGAPGALPPGAGAPGRPQTPPAAGPPGQVPPSGPPAAFGPPSGALPAQPPQAPPAPPSAKCTGCSEPIPANAKFCPHCGHPTAPPKAKCTKCETELDPTDKFCPNCGTPRTETAKPEDAE